MLSHAELRAFAVLQAEVIAYDGHAVLEYVNGQVVLRIDRDVTDKSEVHLMRMVSAQHKVWTLDRPHDPEPVAQPVSDDFIAEYKRTHPELWAAIDRVRPT